MNREQAKEERGHIMLLHINCLYCTSIAHKLQYNRHLSDIHVHFS